MGHIIIHRDGAYNIHSTVTDAPLFESARTLTQLTKAIKEECGNAGLRGLPPQLERAHERGASGMLDACLEETLEGNHAGPKGSFMPIPDYIARYLTFPMPKKPK